jgi:hypothetical protein
MLIYGDNLYRDAFSHLKTSWTHEDGSVLMFDDLIKEYPGIRQYLPEKDVRFIQALILGKVESCPSVLFLFLRVSWCTDKGPCLL